MPTVSALIWTDFLGWILPLAETMASRSRRSIFSAVTCAPVLRLNAKFAYTIPPSTATPTAAMTTFFVRLMKSYLPVKMPTTVAATAAKRATSTRRPRKMLPVFRR